MDPIKTKNDANLKKDSDVPKIVEIEIKDANGNHDLPRDNGHRSYQRIQSNDVINGTSLRSRNSSGGSTGSTKGTQQAEEIQRVSSRESPVKPHPAFRQHSFSPSITELRSASRRNSGSRSSGSSRSQSPTHIDTPLTKTTNKTESNRIDEIPKTVPELVSLLKLISICFRSKAGPFMHSDFKDAVQFQEDQISVLQKELDSSTDFDRRREIRAEIRKIKAKMKGCYALNYNDLNFCLF